MLIRILEIPVDGKDLRDVVKPEWVDVALGKAGRGIVGAEGEIEARVSKVGDKILVQGRAQLPVLLECTRCLVGFEVDLGVDITHMLEPRPEDGGGGGGEADEDSEEEVELDGGDLDVSYIEGPEFDLSDVVREHMHLTLPMNPLCKEECAGLCDQCGCSAPVDPRWAGLADIKLN